MDKVDSLQLQAIRTLKKTRDALIPRCIRKFPLFRLLQSWLFQGFMGAHWKEILFRFCLELALITVLSIILSTMVQWYLLWAVLVVHTFMWTFNGHFWALKINDNKRLVKNTPKRIYCYIEGLSERINNTESITACVLTGSIVEERFHEFSDLDIWFTKKSGFFIGIWAYMIGVRERSIAFFQRIPIELYFYDTENYSANVSKKPLLLLKDADKRWEKKAQCSFSLKNFSFNKMVFFNNTKK